MAKFGIDQEGAATMDIHPVSGSRRFEAFYTMTVSPPEDSAAAKRISAGIKLAEFDPDLGTIKIYPLNTLAGSPGYLGPKYDKIRTLTIRNSEIEDYDDDAELEFVFETLPSGFVKDFAYGLGLLKDCNRLIRLIEDNTSCDAITFTDGNRAMVDGRNFILGESRFAAILGEINRIGGRGSRATGRVKDFFVHNELAKELNIPTTELSLGRFRDSQIITKAANGIEELSNAERDNLLSVVTSESAAFAKSAPEKFKKLQRDIELVSLDRIIDSYSRSLEQGKNEQYWQTFFDDNAFALQQVFGVPMVSVQSGASVGGRGLSGKGDKIADYLFKNSLTNNVALVEIKKPATELLDTREYRNGVFGASRELNGAVTQVLDQAYQLTKNFAGLKESSLQWDLESYAVSCFVIAGRTPKSDNPAKQKSLELFRANSRNVTIVTYDEILERIKLLRDFLRPEAMVEKSVEAAL
ncbi:Shedu immune nuclease family protein [Glutamicibacter creatinolyticus]|uniref:Shedu immune nuclease family protein n=1 Tax=Glutamicibacter creatinolyticus TaxID=162496 RepID=UPI0037C11EC2